MMCLLFRLGRGRCIAALELFLLFAHCLGEPSSPEWQPEANEEDHFPRTLQSGEGDCTDDANALTTAIGSLHPAFPSYLSAVTCPIVVENGDQLTAAAYAVAGSSNELILTSFSCSTGYTASIGDVCRGMETTTATCSDYDDLYLVDLCCASCFGGASTSSWSLGTIEDYQDEAVILAEFLYYLGYLNATSTPGDLCDQETVGCEGSGYWVELSNVEGMLSEKVSELSHLTSLVIDGGTLAGGIPEGFGNLPLLTTLTLQDVGLTGELPSDFVNMTSIQYFDVSDNSLSGSIDPTVWLSWPKVTFIDLSHNKFEGSLPSLNFTHTPKLAELKASYNYFTNLTVVDEPVFSVRAATFALRLDNNRFTSFPSQLRSFVRLAGLYLHNNQITEIPAWGYWQVSSTHEWTILQFAGGAERSSYRCVWRAEESDAAKLPDWPQLTTVTLDNNNFGDFTNLSSRDSTVRRFLVLFSYAPRISKLTCQNCSLSGNIQTDMRWTTEFRLVPSDDDGYCLNLDSWDNLESLDLEGNPNIAFNGTLCEVLEPAGSDSTANSKISCYSCPGESVVSSFSTPPLASSSSCVCRDTFQMWYSKDGSACGCSSGDYLNSVSGLCETCPDEWSCEWESAEESLGLPTILAGSWMPCLPSRSVDFLENIYTCYNEETCPGGEVRVSCTAEEEEEEAADPLCAAGRHGIACGYCISGYYGSPDGECYKCQVTQNEARLQGGIGLLCLIPVMSILSGLLGRSGRMAKFALLKKLKLTFRQLLKHMQILAVVSNIQIEWPDEVGGIVETCNLLSVQFDKFIQLGCWAGDQTSSMALLVKWLSPLAVIPLLIASIPLSRFLQWFFWQLPGKCRGYAQFFQGSFGAAWTFLYMLWNVYFATLTSNSFLMFNCNKHPNGDMRIALYPDVVCWSGDFWILSIGGILAIILYVVCFFGVSYWALQHVAESLKNSCFLDRGPYEFVTDGLRTSHIHFNVYSAMKDTLLSLTIVAFSHDTTSQLFISAFILFAWSAEVVWAQPFDTWTSNMIEAWSSAFLAIFLIFLVGFGFAIPGVHDVGEAIGASSGSQSTWLLATLIASFAVPFLLLVVEVCSKFEVLNFWIPESVRPQLPAEVKKRVMEFQETFDYNEMMECMQVMDHVEFNLFLKAIGSSSSRKVTGLGVRSSSRLLKDPGLASVRMRASALRKNTQSLSQMGGSENPKMFAVAAVSADTTTALDSGLENTAECEVTSQCSDKEVEAVHI